MKNAIEVPLFIVEEHNEAYFTWNYGYFKGFINPFGNTLLHVDSHDDMVIALLNSSVDELEDDLQKIFEYTYKGLGIADFIVPAIYQGILNNYTFLNRYDNYTGKKTNQYIASYNSMGTYFKIGEINPILRLQLESDKNQWGKYHFFTHQEIGLGSNFTTSQPLILDIDLDYFSCDNSLSSIEKKIEITEQAYNDFISNKYHPFKILPAAAATVSRESGHYYLYFGEWQEVANMKKVSSEIIEKRIGRFIDFLTRNNIRPGLIDICRSRYSGYTPADQWEFIETKLLDALNDLYQLNITHINEFNRIYGGALNVQGNFGSD